MTTHNIQQPTWAVTQKTDLNLNLWQKYLQFADSQHSFKTAWWILNLMIHSLLVPITFLVVYSLAGLTMLCLSISMISFFINIVANMSGASIRYTILLLTTSIILHLGMIALTFGLS